MSSSLGFLIFSDLDFVPLFLIIIDFVQKIGAINNIVKRPDGGLIAFNTDYIGAIDAIEDGLRGCI